MSYRETKRPFCRYSPRGKNSKGIICPHPDETKTTEFCLGCAIMHVAGRLDKILKKLNDIDGNLGDIARSLKQK